MMVKCQMALKSFFMEDTDAIIQHFQYHDWGWSGDSRNRWISSHDTELVLLEYSCFDTESMFSVILSIIQQIGIKES